MEKLVYLLHQSPATPGPDLRTGLIDKAAPALREAGATQISVNVNDEHVAVGSAVTISRSDPPIRAMVSFWLQNHDDRGPCEAALAGQAEVLHGYLTVESRPVVHSPPLSPSGERAPGANLVTVLNKKADISYEKFFDHWYDEHKTVACEIQSTFGYVRNVVARPLTAGAPPRDGIVEESFPIEALSNPHVWYDCDNEDEYKRRLTRMMDSVNAFLDLSVLESVPMSEYWLG